MLEETLSFQVDGLTIKGRLYLPSKSLQPHPFLCLCHGIPAKPYDPKDQSYQEIARIFCQAGFAAFIFNFRGTGESEGDFDILGWARDLEAAINLIYEHPGIDRKRFAILGSSAGAAVAVYYTAHSEKATHLVTLACPASFGFTVNPLRAEEFLKGCREVGIIRSKNFPEDREKWLDSFENISPLKWIDGVSPRPLFLVHGSADELISPQDAQRLFEKAREPKELVYIPGGEHRLRTDPRAMSLCLEWLKKRIT